jgi:hypothetical protein
MPVLVKARSFLRNLFLSGRVEADLDHEVHAHLEMLIAIVFQLMRYCLS